MFAETSLQMSSVWPGWLLASMLAALLIALGHGVVTMLRKHVKPRWVAGLAALRMAAWLVFALCVLQPVLSWTRVETPRPALAILIDTSKSMEGHLPDLLAKLRQGELATAFEQRYQPRWLRFDATATPITKADVAKLTASGATTRLADSLAAACDLLRAEGAVAPRLLLVSDGVDQGGVDPVETARRLGVTVDVLAPTPAQPASPSTLAIADVQGARRVLLGSETHFRVTLRGPQATAQDHKATLKVAEDGKHLFDVPVSLAKGKQERTVTLAHRPISSGTKQYAFQLADGDAGPVQFPVQVIDGKFEILMLEDVWRWEYKYLHRLFEDDPSFRFTALLARGGGSFTQFGSPDRRVNLIGFPQSRSELEAFDLFFLGDVNPQRWPPRLAAGLAHLVEEEGKSLVVIAGANLAQFAEVPELHALLPVEIVPASGKPVTGPVPVRLRPDASSSPFFFQIGADQVDALPPLDQLYPPLRKRPGATVLVEAAKHRNPYGPLVVAAEHTVGRGRVLFIGTDVLWKWHTLAPAKDGPTPYGLFWQQALRALTPERSRFGTIDVWLRASRSRAELGQRLELVAEVQSERPLPQARLQASATLPGGDRVPLALTVDPARPNVHRAEFAPPKAGVYAVTAEVIVDGQRAAAGNTLVHVESPHGEASDGDVDIGQLERLASATGGRRIDPARPDTWPSPEATSAPSVSQPRTFAAWDNFTLLVLLVSLLGADWFFRLMKGLV